MPRTADKKIDCACGGSYLDSNRAKHNQTKKHQKWDWKTRNQHEEQGDTLYQAPTTPPERLDADGDLHEYNINEVFNPFEFKHYTDVDQTPLPDVKNFMLEKAKEGYVLDAHGHFIRKDGFVRNDINLGFAHPKAIEQWFKSFNEKSNEDDYVFVGTVRYVKDHFSRIKRSKWGTGASFKHDIFEYKGEHCHIPTGTNCFIKCFNHLLYSRCVNMTWNAICQQCTVAYYNQEMDSIVGDIEDDYVLCAYQHEGLHFALLSKSKVKEGFKELTETGVERAAKRDYTGYNCYTPKRGDGGIDSMWACIFKLMTERYKAFLYKDRGQIRNGVMTRAKIGAFNEAFKSSMVYYNPQKRQLLPKEYAKIHTDSMVLYLHNNHYCLLDKDNKAAGIREVEANFK